MDIKGLGNPICILAEGPLWNEVEQALYWTDIESKKIWRYKPKNSDIECLWEGKSKVGGFAFTPENNLVMCTNRGIFFWNRSDNSSTLLHHFDFNLDEDERFNDITTDPQGRIFAGTIENTRKKAKLYRIEKNKEPVLVLDKIGLSNGMTFSLDTEHFYHTDTHKRSITRFDYSNGTGEISNPQIFYQGDLKNGFPDGITMDRDGFLWVACWGASQIIRINPKGEIVERLSVPAMQPSSITFGGTSLNELYITTACQGAADLTKGLSWSGEFLGGSVFKCKLKIRGRKEWLAQF